MKRLLSVSMVLACAMVLLSGCNCYNRMLKKVGSVQTSCNPAILSLRGSEVVANVTMTFPPKYFDEMAVLKVTPVLVFDGGTIAGTPKFVQGENVKDNYTVISWKEGGSYTQTVTFPYDERARLSTLELRIEAKCANQCSEKYNEFLPLAAIPVAQGVSTLQSDADWTKYMTIMPDEFKKVNTTSKDASIMFKIGQAKVEGNALSSDQVKLFESFVKDNSKTEAVNIASKGYASPDGPVKLNDDLSQKRAVAAKDAANKQLTGVNAKYDIQPYGEDWDGFKALVQSSNIQDKDLILQVLEMSSNPVQRESEIRNMSAVFKVLATDVLPKLRRAQLVALSDAPAKSDAEIKSLSSTPEKMNVEETLYAATLTEDNAAKAKLYTSAATRFNDARAYNNLAVAQAKQGKYVEAKKSLDQAAKLKSDPAITNNLGVIAMAQGNYADAQKYFSSLNSTDAKSNKALMALASGNYAEAAKNLSGYDLAVAQVLNGNLSGAKQAISNDKSADADYLRAIIAMREGDSKTAIAQLKSSFAKDPSLKAKAQKDVEFAKLFGTSEFLAL